MNHYALDVDSRAYASDDESLLRHRIFRRRIDVVRNKHGRPGSRRYRRYENNILAHMHQELDGEDKIVPQCPYEMNTYFLDVGLEFFHNPQRLDDICPNKKPKKLPKIAEIDACGDDDDEGGDDGLFCGDDEGLVRVDPLAAASPTASTTSSLSAWELVDDPSKDNYNMPGSGDNDEIGVDDDEIKNGGGSPAAVHRSGRVVGGGGGEWVSASHRQKDFYPELTHWSDVQLFAVGDRIARTNFRLVTRCLRPLIRKHQKSLFLYEIDRVLCAYKSANKDECMSALRNAMTFRDFSISADVPQELRAMVQNPGTPDDTVPLRLVLELKDALGRLLIRGVCQFYGLLSRDHIVTKEETIHHLTIVEYPRVTLHTIDAHHFEVLPPSLRVSLCDHLNSTQAL